MLGERNCMNNIRKIREEKGMKQIDLAQTIGISVGYLCHLENGTRDNPSMRTMVKIAKALNRSIEEIFTFSDK